MTAKEVGLMLACRKSKISYRKIEAIFHLKRASGMDAYRVCAKFDGHRRQLRRPPEVPAPSILRADGFNIS